MRKMKIYGWKTHDIMERYDYIENIKDDIRTYIEDNNIDVNSEDFDYDGLYDDLFASDSVTGNASGSYTFNTWEAEENVCHNLDLLAEAMDEFNCDMDNIWSAEWCDVTIRCYLLQRCLGEVVDELKQEEDGEDEDNN